MVETKEHGAHTITVESEIGWFIKSIEIYKLYQYLWIPYFLKKVLLINSFPRCKSSVLKKIQWCVEKEKLQYKNLKVDSFDCYEGKVAKNWFMIGKEDKTSDFGHVIKFFFLIQIDNYNRRWTNFIFFTYTHYTNIFFHQKSRNHIEE